MHLGCREAAIVSEAERAFRGGERRTEKSREQWAATSGEAVADSFKRRGSLKLHGTENMFQTHEGMVRAYSTPFKHLIAVFIVHDDGIAAIGGLACLTPRCRDAVVIITSHCID